MKAIYIGHIGKKGTAMAIHTRSIAQLLEELNYKVSFVVQYVDEKDQFINDKYKYFYTKQIIKLPKLKALEWMFEEILGIKLFLLFKKIAKKERVDLVIFYGYSSEKLIINFCKKNNIKIIVDRTDWFEKEDRKGIFGKIFTWFTDKCITDYDLKTDGVISISNYFYNFYKNNKQKTIWLPPIFNIENNIFFINDKEKIIKLVYAGSLGGQKDTIIPVIKALQEINRNDIKFHLNLIGISSKELEKYFYEDLCKIGVYAHGKKSHEKTLEILKKSDFSILLRQNKRYAKAGFSTKFAESMYFGVPVICTSVGGADTIIENNKDGILLENNEIETIKKCFFRILSFDKNEIADIKQNAYVKGKKIFSGKNYLEIIREFLS